MARLMAIGWWSELMAVTTAVLNRLDVSMTGMHADIGTVAAVLPRLHSSITGHIPIEDGAISASLQGMSTAAGGNETNFGAFAVTTAQMVAALTGLEVPQGTIAVSQPQNITALIGSQLQTGTVAGILSAVSTALSAQEIEQGTLAVVLKQAVSALAGAQTQSGTMAAALKQAITTLAGSIAGTPTFSSAGAGQSGVHSALGWSDTIASSVNAAALLVTWEDTAAGSTASASIGGVSMGTPLTTVSRASTTFPGLYLYAAIFGLLNPPTGTSKAVAVNFTGTFGTYYPTGDVVYYTGASGFGTPATTNANAKAASLAISAAVGQLVFGGFGNLGQQSFGNLSGTGQTTRYNQAAITNTAAAVIGDAPGAATVTLASTQTAAIDYIGLAVPIH